MGTDDSTRVDAPGELDDSTGVHAPGDPDDATRPGSTGSRDVDGTLGDDDERPSEATSRRDVGRPRKDAECGGPASRRRWRTVPTAVTPVTASDLLAGAAAHAVGRGREGFRDDVAGFLGAERTATFSSYRRALAAAFRALASLDPESGAVLIPAFCSSDFGDAIAGVGLEVRRYDVDPRTLAADMASLREAEFDDALAVVAVNVLGYGSDVAAMADVCDANDVFLVEALGYALGASYDDRRLGTYGDASVVNFQQGKPIPVGGGMVVSQRDDLDLGDAGRPAASANVAALAGYAVASRPRPHDLYTRLREAVGAHGRGGGAPSTHPEGKFDVAYDDGFRTMSNFQCAIARRVLDRLPETREERARNARFYADAFRDCEFVDAVAPVDGLSNHQWVRFPLLVQSNELRGELHRSLQAEGVDVPLLYNWPKVRRSEFPGARTIQRRILPLPTHPYVDERDRRRIVDVVHEVAAAYHDRL